MQNGPYSDLDEDLYICLLFDIGINLIEVLYNARNFTNFLFWEQIISHHFCIGPYGIYLYFDNNFPKRQQSHTSNRKNVFYCSSLILNKKERKWSSRIDTLYIFHNVVKVI